MVIFGLICCVLCGITAGLIWRYLQHKAESLAHTTKSSFIVPWLITIVCSVIFLFNRITSPAGLDFSFYNTLLISALVVSTILCLISTFKRVEFLGLFVLPITLVCIGLNVILLQPRAPILLSAGILVHIVTSIVAFSILCLGAIQAILLLVQDRQLKTHTSPGILRAIPSLHENETTLFQSIGLGVVVLAISLGTGFIYLDDIFGQHLIHKTILSSLAWVVFVTLLWGRVQFGWRGPTAIRWTLGGFTFLILAYFGSKFVLELILNRT